MNEMPLNFHRFSMTLSKVVSSFHRVKMVSLYQIFQKKERWDGTKNIKRRVIYAFIILIVFLIGDELIKEGHFTLTDFLKPLTHEFLILLVILALSIYLVLLHTLSHD